MLALDATFFGIDPTAWRNLQRALRPPPPPATARPPRARSLPLVLFIERGRLVQYLRPGPLPTQAEQEAELSRLAGLWRGPGSLAALRRATRAAVVVALEDDVLFRLGRTVEGRVHPSDDLATQALLAAEALRAEVGRGLHLDPNPFLIPHLRPEQARRLFDLLLPDDRSAVLYIVDQQGEGAPPGEPRRPRVWASLALCKRRGALTQITTHQGLGFSATDPSYDLRRDAQRLGQAAAARLAPVHVGLYITLSAWRRVVSPQPGALAAAVALGEAVLDPTPPWLIATVGLGAATGIAEGAGRLLGRFVPKGVMDLAKQVGQSPFQAIGVDPLDLWKRLTQLARGDD